jgi:hypothetical protein
MPATPCAVTSTTWFTPEGAAAGAKVEAAIAGDLAHRFPEADLDHDLELPGGQPLVHGSRRVVVQVNRKSLGKRRAHVPPAGQDLADGPDQFFRRAFLPQIAKCAGLEHAPSILLIFGMHTEDLDRELGLQHFEVAENIQTASARHRDIQNHQVPGLTLYLGENLLRILSLSAFHTFQVAQQNFFQSFAQNRMVVGQENFDHFPPSPAAGV